MSPIRPSHVGAKYPYPNQKPRGCVTVFKFVESWPIQAWGMADFESSPAHLANEDLKSPKSCGLRVGLED